MRDTTKSRDKAKIKLIKTNTALKYLFIKEKLFNRQKVMEKSNLARVAG